MSLDEANTVDQIETAADIEVVVDDVRVPVSEVDVTKDIEMEEVRHNALKANGISVTEISYSGSLSFHGYRITGPDGRETLDDLLYDDAGIPVPCQLVIYHDLEGDDEVYEDVFFQSKDYSGSETENTETNYDWIAMNKQGEDPDV